MRSKKSFFACALALAFLGPAKAANTKSLCGGFLPPNNARVPVGATFMGEPTGISEQQFNATLDRVQQLYGAEVHGDRRANFVIERNWKGDVVNAYATQSDGGKTWTIHMYGGLARYLGMTQDGFAAVACHETGHHLGGAPKFRDDDDSKWATVEGESDYFAMLKCLRRYFEYDDNEKVLAGMKLNPTIVKSCNEQFTNHKDALICVRSAEAGVVLGRLLANLGGEKQIAIETPDASQATGIDEAHPRAQCRLDTYYSASLCTVPVYERRSDTDFKAGSCYDKKLTQNGLRPKCWFNP